MLRVSTSQIMESSLTGINDAYTQFSVAQSQVDTGKILQKPSDNPYGTAQVLGLQDQISEIDQYGRTMDQANGFLSTSESALSTVSNLLSQARSIGIQGANGSLGNDTLTALAGQIQNIIGQLGEIGNTSYGSQYVFGGQRSTVPPFAASGSSFTYNGGTSTTGDDSINLTIGRGESMTVNVSGDKVFTPVFAALGQLRDDLAYGNTNGISQNDLAAMDAQINNVLGVRADFGSKINRISETLDRNAQTKISFTQFVSNIQDANIPESVVHLQTAQTAYQAALEATAKTFQNSLLDFIK
ncbi:MAG TPA: flagellar hook-associated protein FlgL [Chthonomonadaceae bacterium]|nr:flagellar hook-associated protein FlgL [Chthonomonadaceae bacterium]